MIYELKKNEFKTISHYNVLNFVLNFSNIIMTDI